MGAKVKREDRFINPDLRRSFRKTYNVNEVKWGAAVVGGLILVLTWVLWKGAHPDPTLFDESAGLLVNSGSPADRGVLPKPLAPTGWKEASVSRFGPENLYEKINGREGFYKGFGFEQLTFASLVAEDDPSLAIDIELYDLGESLNAVGCYAAERQPDANTVIESNGLHHRARNGLFITRGRFYARAIAPDESDKSLQALRALQDTLGTLPSEALPWGYQIFATDPRIDSSTIEAFQQDAFSFSFAKNVFTAKIGRGETTVFISPSSAVDQLVSAYRDGFGALGEIQLGSIPWVKDRYLGEISGATSVGDWVVGVQAGTDLEAAEFALELIRGVASNAPDSLLKSAQALSAPQADPAQEPATETSDEEY